MAAMKHEELSERLWRFAARAATKPLASSQLAIPDSQLSIFSLGIWGIPVTDNRQMRPHPPPSYVDSQRTVDF